MVNKVRQGRKVVKLIFLNALDILNTCPLTVNSNKYHERKIGVDFAILKYQTLSKRGFTYVCEIKLLM